MHKIPFLLLLVFTACSQSAEVVKDIPIITFDITKESNWTNDSIECKFIALETKDECLLSFIYDVQFYKDKIKPVFAERFGVIGGNLMLVRNENYFVMPLYAKKLKEQYTFREDLKQIIENINEESNPILCLFKFI